MKPIEYKGVTIYKRFFAPGIVYYYGTCWSMPMQHRACETKEEAYRQHLALEKFALQEQEEMEKINKTVETGA